MSLVVSLMIYFNAALSACIRGPSNVAIVVGNNVSMSCRPNSTKNSVTWYYTPVNGEDKSSQVRPINNGHVLNRNFSEFSFGGTAPGEVLILNRTQLSHAGLYRCTTEGHTATAQLIVFASEPNCSFAFDQRLLHLSCIVIYNGNWIPLMQWIEMTVNGTKSRIISDNNCSNSPNNVETFSHIVPFAIKSVYVFKLNFAHYSCSKNNSTATNIPDYEYTWKLTSNEIFYGPYNVTVHPKKDDYTSGEHLNCSSDSNPVPKFKWKEEKVGVIHVGPILSLKKFSSRKEPYIIQCLAVNLQTNISASSDPHKVYIANHMPNMSDSDPSDKQPVSFVVSLVAAVLAFVTSALLIIFGSTRFFGKSTITRNRSRVLPSQSEMETAQRQPECLDDLIAESSASYRKETGSKLDQHVGTPNKRLEFGSADHVETSENKHKFVGADGTVYLQLNGLNIANQVPRIPPPSIGHSEFNKSEYASIDHTFAPPPPPPR